jgi:hypothetical protein
MGTRGARGLRTFCAHRTHACRICGRPGTSPEGHHLARLLHHGDGGHRSTLSRREVPECSRSPTSAPPDWRGHRGLAAPIAES